MDDVGLIHHLPVALGIGLLIGAERERRKVHRPAAAGLRTFTIAALLGCGAALMPQQWMIAIVMLCMTALALLSSWRRRNTTDPGITTEVSLVATTLLGALAVTAPLLAGALAVLIAIVLAARDPLHRFVGQTISADEIADILLIAGATLIVLPMLPDRQMGPFDALNPHSIWMVVVMILGINALGQVATRLLGARLGVPALGLISGLVSSSATIGAMGAWVRANPASAAAGAAAAGFFAPPQYSPVGGGVAGTGPPNLFSSHPPGGASRAGAPFFGRGVVPPGRAPGYAGTPPKRTDLHGPKPRAAPPASPSDSSTATPSPHRRNSPRARAESVRWPGAGLGRHRREWAGPSIC